MPHLSLSFLGGFDATLNAETITAFSTNKVRALFAFLAIDSGRPHRRAELADMFWPDMPEKKAAHNLSQSLHSLRQALREREGGSEPPRSSPPFLIITSQDVQFNICSDFELDVVRFRELLNQCDRHQHFQAASCTACMAWLGQAVELYRGDLLGGLLVEDSYVFEEWRTVQQEELHHLAMGALARLAAYHEQRGEWERVQADARRQIALEPWREEAHALLMRALAYSGQTAAALRQYEGLQNTLIEELGVRPSVEVTRLYEQIRAGEVGQPGKDAARRSDGEAAWLPSQGERRPVTALVCGCNACQDGHLLEDADDTHEEVIHCEHYCEAIFRRFGGRRALRQGNVCVVYFGYPIAYEDAAARAVHSALELAKIAEGGRLRSVGVHSGMITVGEKRGRRWQDRDLVGKALELARDFQRQARPGEVIITDSTCRLVQAFFDLHKIDQPLLVGNGQAAAVYQVMGESGVKSRLDWLAHAQRLTAFTGRDMELAQLQTCYERLLQGQGQVVYISGDPGIGKSRLVWELQNRIFNTETQARGEQNSQPDCLWLSGRCLPYDQNSSLLPVIALVEGLASILPEDSSDSRRDKLAALLEQYQLNRPSAVWLLSLLVGLSTNEGRSKAVGQSTTEVSDLEVSAQPKKDPITQAQREQMREVIIALLQKRAAEGPLVLALDDLHWCDPSTLEWLKLSMGALVAAPCLVLLTARPGHRPDWLKDAEKRLAVLDLALYPLDPEQVDQMVTDLAGEIGLENPIRQHIIHQTDGNPLFIEELTKGLLERASLPEETAASIPIPATLVDSLAARLDYLGAAKETAQWAAVLGREFAYAVLQACAPYDEQRLQADLTRLIQAEMVLPVTPEFDGIPSNISQGQNAADFPSHYAFKHTLVQEAAYNSLLKRTRQAYHISIVEALETRFPQMVEARPEIPARHYASAGILSKAVDYWINAGDLATAQGATQEALTFFNQAIAAIDGHAVEDVERRWRALIGRERVLDLRVEREAQQHDITALQELAEVLNDDKRRAEAWLRLSSFEMFRNEYPTARQAAEMASAAAQRAGNLALEVGALSDKLHALIALNEKSAARLAVEELSAKLPAVAADEVVHSGALSQISLYYHHVGDLSRALEFMIQAAKSARRTGNRIRESRIDINIGVTQIQLGLYLQARATIEEGLKLAEELGSLREPIIFLDNLSYVCWCLGDIEQAIALGERALSENRALHSSPYSEAAAMADLGFYQESVGAWAAAAANLAEARAGFLGLGTYSDSLEAQSVEARCMLALERQEEARKLAGEVWGYIREHGSAGIFFPGRVYVAIADVARAIKLSDVSEQEVIRAGYHDLMERAEKISDAQVRTSFLENVRENRETIERSKKMKFVF